MKDTKSILISLGLALIGMLFVFLYVSQQEKRLLEGSTMVKVVVAARDLAEGTRLDESKLTAREVPKKYVQPGSVVEASALFDRIVYVPVLEGGQVIESMLASPERAGLAQKIPQEKVAFTVAVNGVTGVAGLVQPGDYVDVLLMVEVGMADPNTGKTDQEIHSKLVLENILILAVDQRSQRIDLGEQQDTVQKTGSGNVYKNEKDGYSQRKPASTVTLAVSQEECLRIALAQEIGSISLALRSAWSKGERWKERDLESNKFLGVEKPVVRRSLPAWVEIRGASQESRF